MARSARRLVLLGALLAAVFVVALLWPYRGYSGTATVILDQGMSRRAIAARLAREGVLCSRWPFLLYAYAQPHRTLKAGEYDFNQPMSAAAVFGKLARGEVHLYALVVPEGYTRWDIADEVARLRLAPRAALLRAAEETALIRDLAPEATTLEGYLFPDTYYFSRPAEPEQMVRTMVENFRRVFRSLGTPDANPHKLTVNQLVTLASLVEKETAVPEERGLIAAVFYNRLERKMLLACDPTVIYAARLEGDGAFDGVINVSDLERPSPYNTYLHTGLPPGPIAAPGRASLQAVLHPPKSNYLFFVSNTHGGHAFAATAAEHARNVARYRRLREQQERAPRQRGKHNH